ncbi:hypothetical protein RJ639_020261 [Escallonia herrerae]|uniref:Uncharacterized protein n=1 Tax=Escallonia herrerae TaxID=1293975 RepID=A0AA88V4H6_9ASTE|nr:hypothetical protein RJ639_020261 [Escallonia herrerae]
MSTVQRAVRSITTAVNATTPRLTRFALHAPKTVHKEEPARPKETHGQPIRIMRLDQESFHRVLTSQSRPAPTSRNVTRSLENEDHIPQSRPTLTARNVIPSVQNEDHGDAVSCVTLDKAGDTVMIDA